MPGPAMKRVDELHQAQVNRSIRTIKAELEYLCDVAVITPQELSDLLSRVPSQTALNAPISVGAIPGIQTTSPEGNLSQPMRDLNLNGANNNTANPGSPTPSSLNEKQNLDSFYAPGASPQAAPIYNPPTPTPQQQTAPPPQAQWAPTAPPLANATALYAYTSTDAGDLELQPGDAIAVTEYMNAEWWKGRSARTGAEGIFPRSYVRVLGPGEDKGMPMQSQAPFAGGEYGGQTPMYDQSQQQQQQVADGSGKVPSKQGKKFGKKLGNAAIFGAGFSIGGDIVNAIL